MSLFLTARIPAKKRTWLERVNCILIAKAKCSLRKRYPTNQVSKHPPPGIVLESRPSSDELASHCGDM